MFNDITVREFCGLAIEPTDSVEIWSCEAGQNVFEGTFRDALVSDFEDKVVQSFSAYEGTVVINIE